MNVNKWIEKTVSVFIIAALAVNSVTAGAYGWYFKGADNGQRPALCPEADFVDKYNVISIGNAEEKKIYLTFDAGYENGNVEKILDILKANDVKGIFFVLPNLVEKNTELCKRMKQEGHLVGNHSVSHKNMAKHVDIDFFVRETQPLEELFSEKTGYSMDKYFRPPEGSFNEATLIHADKCGYKTVFWSLAYADWDEKAQKDPKATLQKLVSRTHNGCVLLLHPTSETNVKILDEYIKTMKNKGYEFCTIDDIE